MLSSPELVDDLAVQVAPDQEARTWLLQSWEQPAQPLDGSRIAALETAADGTLAAEPHFRAWLRAEWTAWARQRYRRVAREARKVLEAPVREEPVRTVPEGPP
jgi:hypothetical protein